MQRISNFVIQTNSKSIISFTKNVEYSFCSVFENNNTVFRLESINLNDVFDPSIVLIEKFKYQNSFLAVYIV